MIVIEINIKTFNKKFITIFEVFKTQQYDFKNYKYKILILINYNKSYKLINIENQNLK